MSSEEKRKLAARLQRVAGQVGGIQRMVDEDRYCIDVLMQIAAARAALARAGEILLESHVNTCVVHALDSGDPTERREKLDELMRVFRRF